MSKLLLAGTAALLLYSMYRVWTHTMVEKPQLKRSLPDSFDGWEDEVERIFKGWSHD